MFLGPLWVVLTTLVLFNQAAIIENQKDIYYIINFENSTTPSSKTELFRQGTLNENNGESETNANSILKQLTSGIYGYINSYFNSSCKTLNIIPADDEVCLCKNSTVLFFFKKNNCFLVRLNISNIRKKKRDSQ